TGLQLDIVSGNEQRAAAGSELPNPVVIRVRDSAGRAVRNQIVNFRVTDGGGSVYGGATLTNESGIAQDRWRLGSKVGTQTLEARAVDATTGEKLRFAVFRATAIEASQVVATVTVSP